MKKVYKAKPNQTYTSAPPSLGLGFLRACHARTERTEGPLSVGNCVLDPSSTGMKQIWSLQPWVTGLPREGVRKKTKKEKKKKQKKMEALTK